MDVLDAFRPATREWFKDTFTTPTLTQSLGWPAIATGESTLVLAPTGTGKTLAAFLWCIDRLMFEPPPNAKARCRVVYVSPLKALAVDVERNLRVPIDGIGRVATARHDSHIVPAVMVRTGDTPSNERARFQREPADILITTPESLYLLLTSNAREVLRSVDTLIIDEIHALVPTKRGAHLALSMERLETLTSRNVQRIGLSATVRPAEEVARFLGGVAPPTFRPVTIVDAKAEKKLELRIETPVESLTLSEQGTPSRGSESVEVSDGAPRVTPTGGQGSSRPSIWLAIYPRLLELIRANRSTLMFVNGRRMAERLAGALNDLAGETLVGAHHGSIARAQRLEIEESLKAGKLRGLVATSSLELGIDMGAIDLVIQIESPPSVASGLQRIGRAGHSVGAVSRGVLVPKYRGDLIACAAATRAMREGRVESTYYPRNPLDVLAQHIVAMVAMEPWAATTLFDTIHRAAPFADLPRTTFEGVLDMLSGRYPSDGFAELRPRVTWDRAQQRIVAREGARRVAVINGGTIPDRGLYGVFLAGAEKGAARVGELDEEMVFESQVGETFVLGASTWRIESITHDRVVVSPAPGEPGKMPFWRGEAVGRPLEFGRQVGQLVRAVAGLPPGAAIEHLVSQHDLDPQAAEHLVQYVSQQKASAAVPDDETVVIERYRDEIGDWRVCVLSPLGGRVHAPWALAVVAHVRDQQGIDCETVWADDGFAVRFPDTDTAPDTALLLPPADVVTNLVVRQLGASALFAAKFRESAARALLLPRRRPGQRAPLWQQRKRAADLLAVASQFESFPMILEAYRECLRDIFDMPALVETLEAVASGEIRVVTVDSERPSPFAASLLFRYVANYLYEGDTPLAERRAQALVIDQAQLRALVGEAELRELLDGAVISGVESELQCLSPHLRARTADGLHDLFLRLGDLSLDEITARLSDATNRPLLDLLVSEGRVLPVNVAGQLRYLAVEDASRMRDALGVALPEGLPEALLQPVADPLGDLCRRYGRTHGPFTTGELAARFGLGSAVAEAMLRRLAVSGKLLEGEFRPEGTETEWCDADVLTKIRQRSRARLRHEIEPVEPRVLGRFMTRWQAVARPRRGMDGLLDAIEGLEGAWVAASILESEILAARVEDYNPADLDSLLAAGEIVWVGTEPLGERDGRVALYLADRISRFWPPVGRELASVDATRLAEMPERHRRIIDVLRASGAAFFGPLHDQVGGGYPGETVAALWELVWQGVVTNDALHALRAFTEPPERRRVMQDALVSSKPGRRVKPDGRVSATRRATPPEASGRWSLVESRLTARPSETERTTSLIQQLLSRYGILTREVISAEAVSGGFSRLYEVLRTLEERGRVQRGYFVSDVGATQFALPAALELLRSLRVPADEPEVVEMAATDPANPYGAILPWPLDSARAETAPEVEGLALSDARTEPTRGVEGRGPTRTVGATVILVDGRAAAYVGRGGRQIHVWLPDEEPDRSRVGQAVARALADVATRGEGRHGGLLVRDVSGVRVDAHPVAPYLLDAGFRNSPMGFQVRREAQKALQF